jgi:acetylornithine/succinyldiaminopimelate/putrescine aminotransferase
MLECVQGESGVFGLSAEYLLGAEKLCKEKGILLIVDEVQTGMGRTGEMFCFMHYGIKPDIITLAKGLGGGVPIGACLAAGDVAISFEPGDHGSTFGGNPIACAAARVIINELTAGGMLENIKSSGMHLKKRLKELTGLGHVKEIRGFGLLAAAELDDGIKNSVVADKMKEHGFIIGTAGANSLRFSPPYTITFNEIDLMVCALKECVV